MPHTSTPFNTYSHPGYEIIDFRWRPGDQPKPAPRPPYRQTARARSADFVVGLIGLPQGGQS